MSKASISADEKRWQAESDARTLLEAQKIETSKSRKGAALREIKKINKATEKELKIGKKLITKKTTPKKTTRKK